MSNKISKICVYCGSNEGNGPDYMKAAEQLGKLLIERNIELVYGGAGVGIMGKLADTVLKGGGHVTGIIPEHLHKKVAHAGLTQIKIVDTMHTRKAMMIDYSDAMIAMPGGLGTFEEILEAVTWQQLRLHTKPCGLLNVNRYYECLLKFLDNAVAERFMKQEHRDILQVSSDPAELLDLLEENEPVEIPKLYGRDDV
ncbi:MAG: TIGR00730 family Rossman fold protein [Lentisphaerae bacterium]|nr:TIGR00730 family Rossman fold protein [Lentisphaerota bacterium]MCP4101742.1 TIGR00730 family Rossman fold protein [Lentisphaerota bacterium]